MASLLIVISVIAFETSKSYRQTGESEDSMAWLLVIIGIVVLSVFLYLSSVRKNRLYSKKEKQNNKDYAQELWAKNQLNIITEIGEAIEANDKYYITDISDGPYADHYIDLLYVYVESLGFKNIFVEHYEVHPHDDYDDRIRRLIRVYVLLEITKRGEVTTFKGPDRHTGIYRSRNDLSVSDLIDPREWIKNQQRDNIDTLITF